MQARGPSTKSPSKLARNSDTHIGKEQFLAKCAKKSGKPIKIKRQPIPPRKPKGKYEKDPEAMKAEEKKRLPIQA